MDQQKLDLSPRVIDGIRDGQYTLLLGAGASIGATSQNGQPLPSGQAFAQELVQALQMDIAPDTPLAYVWDAAAHKSGSEQFLRKTLSAPRFLGCHPATHHQLVPTFAWKRIYTFNIDDVIPASYKVSGALQTPIPIHFDEDYKDADPVSDECQVVFLHGSEFFPDRPLVFAPPAYAATVTRQHTWWHVFAAAFVSEPFIVIGTSLREPDFETYLAWKRRPPQPLGPPSLYVSPRLDDAIIATCARLGLTPVQMSGEEFLTLLAISVINRERISVRRARTFRSPSIVSVTRDISALATLARQFLVVNNRESWPSVNRPPEKFLEGHSPLWEDIESTRDVALGIVAKIVNQARSFFDRSDPGEPIRMLIVEGTAGSGKTTAIMRAAAGIADLGIDTLFFVGHDRLRDEVLAEAARRLPPTGRLAVVIDDIGDHIHQARRFIANYPTNAGRCFLLSATRSARRRFIETNLTDLFEPRFEPVERLLPAEALELEGKLRAAAKLGRFAGRTSAELMQQFVTTNGTGWGGQLLVILLQVVPGGIFSDRLASEWKSLEDEDVRIFYGTICIAAACGVPIRSPVVFRALHGSDTRRIFSEVFSGSMRALVEWFGQEFVRPRHRVIAEETVRRCMDRDELFQISYRLALALSPYVSRDTIMKRTPEARLARELMDMDGVVIPALGTEAEAWFAALEVGWGWNSRYWEQRALAAMKARRYKRARDFAEQAVGVERHPLPMTTCALVNLASVEHDEHLDRGECEALFQEAIQLLDDAIRTGLSWGFMDMHPYHILLSHSVRVAHKLTGEIPEALRTKLELHAANAERFFGRDPEIRTALDRLKDQGIKWRR